MLKFEVEVSFDCVVVRWVDPGHSVRTASKLATALGEGAAASLGWWPGCSTTESCESGVNHMEWRRPS